MNADHRRIINKNIAELVERTNLQALLPKLLEKEIFLDNMLRKYEHRSVKNRSERSLIRDLYIEIQSRGPNAFRNLVLALHESGHSGLAKLLEPEFKLDQKIRHGPSLSVLPPYMTENTETMKTLREYAENHPKAFINLGTEPLKINVKKAEKPVDLLLHKSSVYPMGSKPKGYAMIINIKQYKSFHGERNGAEHDENNLKELFQGLGYEVILRENLKEKEMMAELERFANDKRHSRVDSCILAILSHGELVGGESTFVSSDGMPIPVSSVLELFSNKNCTVLQKKPKIFFFQSCRGDKKMHGIKHFKFRTKTDGSCPIRLRDCSDMLIAYSTVPGYESHRDIYVGTWFIQNVCQVFMDHACDTEITEMLKMVDARLERLSSENQTMQTSSFENRGFKTFFFNPGIYDDENK